MISAHEKQQISLIEEQVEILLSKGANDDCLLQTLIDFIPDLQCLMHSDSQSISDYIQTKPNFLYFASLIHTVIEK